MAPTTTITRGPHVPGDRWHALVKWVGDSSYLEGGEVLTLQECGFGPEAVFSHSTTRSVVNLSEQGTYRPTTAYYDGEKVHLYDAATGKELASTKDVSKVTVRFEVVCTAN